MLGTCTLNPARSASLREAADVLRTYRRAAMWKRKAESECQQGFLAAIPAPCPKMKKKKRPMRAQTQLQRVQNGAKIDEKSSPNPSWTALGSQEAPKSTQDASKTRPRGARERPRAPQECPRAAQETPGRSQTPPKSTPARSSTSFLNAPGSERCSRD